VIEQKEEIARIGAEVLLVAYDEPSLLAAKMMRGLEVGYRLLLDPDQKAYARWGLGRTTLARTVLSPSLTWRYVKLLAQGERFLGLAPDILQLGGDFVVGRDGRIAFAHAMRDNGDRIEVERLLVALRAVRTGGIK
jgi:peroxiredoxin